MAKVKITFTIDPEGDSVADLDPKSLEFLREHGIRGLDWLQDIIFDSTTAYNSLLAEVFPKAWGANDG